MLGDLPRVELLGDFPRVLLLGDFPSVLELGVLVGARVEELGDLAVANIN